MKSGDILQLLERHDRVGLALVDVDLLAHAMPEQVHTLNDSSTALVRELFRLANLGAALETVVARKGVAGDALRQALTLAKATWPMEVP